MNGLWYILIRQIEYDANGICSAKRPNVRCILEVFTSREQVRKTLFARSLTRLMTTNFMKADKLVELTDDYSEK